MGIICVNCGQSLANHQAFTPNKGTGLLCSDCAEHDCVHCGERYTGEFHMCRDTQETYD